MNRTYHTTIHDLWDDYPHKDKITKSKFKKIIQTANYLTVKQAIYTGEGYVLPKRCGIFSVRKGKTKASRKKYIDFNHFRKTGEKIYHRNKHSEGWFAKFQWTLAYPLSVIKNHQFYKFKPSKVHKSNLAKAIREDNTIIKYYENKKMI